MLVFRSLTTGLLAACVFLLIDLSTSTGAIEPPTVVVHQTEDPAARALRTSETMIGDVRVIDVAPGVSAATVASLIGIQRGERIAMVSDRPVDNNIAAGTVIAEQLRRGARFVDITITDDYVLRRVLVVLH